MQMKAVIKKPLNIDAPVKISIYQVSQQILDRKLEKNQSVTKCEKRLFRFQLSSAELQISLQLDIF